MTWRGRKEQQRGPHVRWSRSWSEGCSKAKRTAVRGRNRKGLHDQILALTFMAIGGVTLGRSGWS